MKKYDELINEAIEALKNNDDLFVEMVEELDAWNGYADGFRCYPMWEIDDLFAGVSIGDFLDKLGADFNHNDDYFVDTIWGLESTDDPATIYRDNVDEGDLLDNIRDNLNHIKISDPDFEELLEAIENYDEEEEDGEE